MRPDLLPPSPPPASRRRGLVRGFVALGLVGLGVAYWAASGGAGFQPETAAMAEARAAAEPAEVPAEVEVTRAESATDELVAPAPDPLAGAGAAPAEVALSAPEPAPAGLPEEALGADEALAALAPDLAAPAAPASGTATDAVRGLELAAAPGADLRAVTGDRVNVREGPGTGFAVVGQLVAGEQAEVTEVRDGWARVRVGATEGWMSERFLGAPGG